MVPEIQGLVICCVTLFLCCICGTVVLCCICGTVCKWIEQRDESDERHRDVAMANLGLIRDDDVEGWVPIECEQSDKTDEGTV